MNIISTLSCVAFSIQLALAAEKKQYCGEVKWYNESKGSGFIEPDDGGEAIYFPYSAVDVFLPYGQTRHSETNNSIIAR
jgi:hypothetical protein